MAGSQVDMEQVHMSIRPLLLKLGDYMSLNLQLILVSSHASLLRNGSGRGHAVLAPPSGDNSNAYAIRVSCLRFY